MTIEPNAIGALRRRRNDVMASMRYSITERDRYQLIVDQQQGFIARGMEEVNSIDKAIELLEAATEYAGDPTEEDHQP